MTDPLDREDVLSWGIIGLLDAIETYDPERRTKFESYAISKIRRAILDELRRADPLTRRVRRWANEVELARSALAQRLGRAPTEKEVARKLGVGISEHRVFLERCSRVQVGSLETRLECEGYLHGLVADSRAVNPQSAAETAELRARLVEATGFRGAGAGGDYLLFLRTADLEGDRRVPQPHRGSHLADTAPGASQPARDALGGPTILGPTVALGEGFSLI
jgi:RNA polymerase sigma factor (sigma-70 family)